MSQNILIINKLAFLFENKINFKVKSLTKAS